MKAHTERTLQVAVTIGHDKWSQNINRAITHTSSTICWKPIPSSWVKVNFDGSVKKNNKAAMEFVIRDHHGSFLFSGTKNLGGPTSSPLNLLLVEKVYHKAQAYMKVPVEGDLKILIESTIAKCTTVWRNIKILVKDILWLT